MWRLDRPGVRATVLEVAPPLFRRSVKPMALTTSAIGYVRLHGRNYLQWFSKKADVRARYDYLYSAQELEPWVDRIRTVAEAYIDRCQAPVWKGRLDAPKNGKHESPRCQTARSPTCRNGGISRRPSRPDALVFPSENPKTPVSRRNILERPIFAPPGEGRLEWATFQAVRKTNATLSRKAGVDANVSADQRGHGLGVSLEVYTASDR
jgi:hypothetical protein